jgi:homoserine dehydrogenase
MAIPVPQPFRIGIAGLGTVGSAVLKLLQDNDDLIAARAGRKVEIAAVSALDRKKNRGTKIAAEWIDDPAALASFKQLDAVVELIGGHEGTAAALAEKALRAGRNVVTANKALLAHRGHELALLAEEHGAALMFEAAVAGGIPLIKTLREGLSANNINAIYGILNGTCNYILTTMRESGEDFTDVLAEAQEKGYAEADPAFDIDGIDAAHKLCVLTALAYGVQPDLKTVKTSGIRHITAKDIGYALELGYRIKLLGITRRTEKGIVQSVEACLVPEGSMLGAVEGVYNGIRIEGDFAGTGLSVGRGAGGGPTASAVVADIVDLARGHKTYPFGIPARSMKKADWVGTDDLLNRFYMHLQVIDRPGVLADVSAIMRDNGLSIEAVIQRGRDPVKPVSIVLTTHVVKRRDMEAGVEKIAKLQAMAGKPCLLRIESF